MAEWDGFAVEGRLGSGTTGTVWLARQLSLGRQVAIKELTPELAGIPAVRDRLRHEAQILARLDHPNCVAVYSYLESGSVAAIVMEYVEGVSLRTLIDQSPLSVEQALSVLEGALGRPGSCSRAWSRPRRPQAREHPPRHERGIQAGGLRARPLWWAPSGPRESAARPIRAPKPLPGSRWASRATSTRRAWSSTSCSPGKSPPVGEPCSETASPLTRCPLPSPAWCAAPSTLTPRAARRAPLSSSTTCAPPPRRVAGATGTQDSGRPPHCRERSIDANVQRAFTCLSTYVYSSS